MILCSLAGVIVLLSLYPGSSVEESIVYLISIEYEVFSVIMEDELRVRLEDRFERCTLGRRIQNCQGDFGDESVYRAGIGCAI